MKIYVEKFAKELKVIKQDRTVPELQKEFYDKQDNIGKLVKVIFIVK